MTRANVLRFTAAAFLSPAATTGLATAGFCIYANVLPSGEELQTVLLCGLATGYFTAFVNFLPLYFIVRRFLRMSVWLSTGLGAVAGWYTPVTYMLTMAVWRGEALKPWVLSAGDSVISPWLAFFGAIGGLIFWFIARKAESGGRETQRAACAGLPAPVNGFSGS